MQDKEEVRCASYGEMCVCVWLLVGMPGRQAKTLICEQAPAWAEERDRAIHQATRDSQQKIRALERELQRKEKALAEAAALLVLAKKAEAIWGDKGE